MSNIPKQWNRSLASIQNCCQTFLSSCCDYNYRNTTSKPPILVHLNPTAKTTEFSNPFYINTSDKQQTLTKRILPRKIIPANLNLQPPINNPALVPLSSLQIEDQKNAISEIIYSPELTPPPSPALRSMAPSPEPMDHLKNLENITNLYSKFGLINEFEELEFLEELAKIERNVIEKFRAKGISRSEARQLSNIDTKSQNTRYQV